MNPFLDFFLAFFLTDDISVCFVFVILSGTRAAAGCQTWKGQQTGLLTQT